MKFINKWSYGLANYMAEQLGHNHEKRHVYYYGFQIIIGGIVKFLVLLLATLITGIFLSTFTTLLFFGALRVPGGGYHMGSYVRCMVASSLMFMLSGFIVEYTCSLWSQGMLAALAAAVFLTALLVAWKWAPADTPYKPINKPGQIRALKSISVIVVFLWAGAEAILIVKGLSFASLAGSLGILTAAFIISPAGYRFFDFISDIGRKHGKTASMN